jgi:hypothetical protein
MRAQDLTSIVVIVLGVIVAYAIAKGFRRGYDEKPAQPWGRGVGPPPGQQGSIIRPENLPPVLTRTYRGKPNEVEVLRAADAEALAGRRYFPSTQSYLEGQWGRGAWFGAVILLFVLGLGLPVLLYMVAVKPAGSLIVNYERRLESRNEPDVAPIWAGPPQ